ncbi:hypothetical protein [Porphyromonas loveana]|uniref:hypothetical protein n=1 Tax=Porphyromonas loveana TaxID=1884669 RepID=UPI0035A0683B
MTRCRYALALCLVLWLAAAIYAQEPAKCDDADRAATDFPLCYYPQTTSTAATAAWVDQTGELCMLTGFDPSVLNLLAGDELVGVRFLAQPITNKQATVVVRKDGYDAANLVAKPCVLPSGAGAEWVEVMLDEPILIERDIPLYVGALLQVSNATPQDQTPLSCHPSAPPVARTSFVRYPDGEWVDLGERSHGPLLIQAIVRVEEPDKLHHLLVCHSVRQPRGYAWEGGTTLFMRLMNLGTEPIIQAGYTVAINGVSGTEQPLALNIAAGSTTTEVEIPVESVVAGANEIRIGMVSADGYALPSADRVVSFDRPDPALGNWDKQLLLECMSAEWCVLCPDAKARLFEGISLLDTAVQERIHPVFIHPKDQLTAVYPDPLRAFDALSQPLGIIGLPVVVADRNYNGVMLQTAWAPPAPDEVQEVLEAEYGNGRAPAAIRLSVSSGTAYRVDFSGEVNKLYAGRKFRLTGYFMKETMPPVGSQQGAGEGYQHKHTLLLLLTDPQGEEVTIAEDGSFALSKEFVLDGISPEDTELVGVLHYPLDGQLSTLNTCRVSLQAALPIGEVTPQPKGFFRVMNRTIVTDLSGIVEVFATDGRRVLNGNLPAGHYIARTFVDGRAVLGKVLVQE